MPRHAREAVTIAVKRNIFTMLLEYALGSALRVIIRAYCEPGKPSEHPQGLSSIMRDGPVVYRWPSHVAMPLRCEHEQLTSIGTLITGEPFITSQARKPRSSKNLSIH